MLIAALVMGAVARLRRRRSATTFEPAMAVSPSPQAAPPRRAPQTPSEIAGAAASWHSLRSKTAKSLRAGASMCGKGQSEADCTTSGRLTLILQAASDLSTRL